jgi:superfamily II DNA or RNA helicase
MADVAQISQSSVKASGIMLRMHAVRTEKDQVCYQPLQPYWDEDSIRKHCHPWQQMLMFFVRTQRSDEQNPKYKFSRRQFTAFEQLLKEAERVVQGEEREVEDQQTPDQLPSSTSNKAPASLDSLQLACLNFCIELLNQKVNDNEYDCALVCAAALLGVSPSESGWRDATTYPQILSSIIKIAHFLIVQKAVELSRVEEEESSFSLGQSLEDFDDSGYQSHSSPVSKSVRRSRLDWVVQMMDRFMVRRTNSPMDWFLDLRTYGMKIQFNTTAEGHVMWKDRHILQYKTLSFSMASFRAMVYDLQQSTRKALFENLLFAPQAGDVPSIPWHALYDDPSNSSVGWNFLDDPRNQLPVDGRSWLPNRIEKIDEIRDRFLRNGSISGFSREYITDFLRQVYYFRGLLLVLIHLTGGQPARGTEILSVRHRNTAQGSHRNLFIEDGLVVFVTRYSKGYQLRGDVKIIHRYLPREVGELVVWYLWLVLPFVQQIEALLWKQDQISSHLWPADVDGKRWTTDRMTKVLKQTSLTSLQQPLTVQSYRQIAIAISREWLQGETPFPLDNESDGDNEGSSPDHAADLQATHSSHIAGMVYARESTERSGVNAGLRQRFRKVSLDWHCFLRFPSTSKRAPDAPKYPFEEEELTAEHARRRRLQRVDVQKEVCQMLGRSTILRDGQAAGLASVLQGTSPIVAVMPTGSGKSLLFMLPAWLEPRGVSIVVVPLLALREDLIFRCQQVGIQCAIWDGRQQPDGATLVFVTPEKAVDEAFSSYLSRLKQARQLDRIVIDECHVVLNDQLHFRPHLQRLGQLAQGETQMLLLTATLPPCQQNDLFVRMSWLPADVHLIRARTTRPNLRYAVIEGGPTTVTHRAALTQIVQSTRQARPQSKILIICQSIAHIQQIVQSGLFPCHAYYAKLRPIEKQSLLQGFRNGEISVLVASGAFGAGIDIPDIHLVIHADEPRTLLEYGQESGRAGRDQAPTLAVILRGGIPTTDVLVKQYLEQTQCRRVLLNDYLDGARDRKLCFRSEQACDLCQPEMPVPFRPESTVTDEETGHNPLLTLDVETSDDSSTDSELSSEESTDEDEREPRPPPILPPSRLQAPIPSARGPTDWAQEQVHIQAQEQTQIELTSQDFARRLPLVRQRQQTSTLASTLDSLRQRLERWKTVCVPCRVEGRPYRHLLRQCPVQSTAIIEQGRQQLQLRIKYAPFSCCFKCGVPQVLCDRWTADGRVQQAQSCQFFGVLIGVVCGFRYSGYRGWQKWIEEKQRQGRRFSNDVGLDQFLGEKRLQNGLACPELVSAFLWLTQYFEEGVLAED